MTLQNSLGAGLLEGGQRAGAAAAAKEVTTATFRQDVLTESTRQPVLVDFWAPWCGPCKQLGPVIEKAVAASAGKVKLVKMNIDEHPEIAGQLGIQSIPAVIAFQKGQPIDGFVGALPESQVRQFIERLVGPVGDPIAEALEEAEAAIAEGDAETAQAIYADILAQDEGNAPALAGLAKLHLEAGALEEAKAVLASATGSAAAHPSVVAVRAAVDLAEQSVGLGEVGDLERRVETDGDDHRARFDLALALNAANNRQGAADCLLEIIKRDRSWDEDGARKQLLQFFDAWGMTDKATLYARRKLSGLLFR